MKQYFRSMSFVAMLAFAASCASHTEESTATTESTADTVATLVEDTTASTATEDSTQTQLESISGEVKEVTPGKDGYTAKLVTSDNKTYFATVSHANLKENASQYRAVKVGETIQITGEIWKMGEEDHVTVRSLK
ncbi:hypothetical protein [Xanthocytophaga flava]|nr:hypothetical protein [Xanthocytophaga flavus]